jgi:hypothetical protein
MRVKDIVTQILEETAMQLIRARSRSSGDLSFRGAPWQKGGIENAIGRMRRVLPRKAPPAKAGTAANDDRRSPGLLGLYPAHTL